MQLTSASQAAPTPEAVALMLSLSHAHTRHQDQLCREWAAEVKGWAKRPGGSGGWVYTNQGEGRPVCQGWSSIWYWHRREICSWLTRSLTAFDSFEGMVQAAGGFRPTLLILRPSDWRAAFLADEYDREQAQRNDPRRAYRGQRYHGATL